MRLTRPPVHPHPFEDVGQPHRGTLYATVLEQALDSLECGFPYELEHPCAAGTVVVSITVVPPDAASAASAFEAST